MSNNKRKNPFKGLYSYEEEDKKNFKGRAQEVKDLFDLVKLNTLTLVFGKSGIGKTSLIHAGLFPRLREVNFLPVPIRLGYTLEAGALLKQIIRSIQSELKEHHIKETEKGSDEETDSFREGETLWEYFHRVGHVNGSGDRVTPVLVLDQFEEFFTIGKNHSDRDKFVEELYYLVEDQLPDALQKQFLEEGIMYPYINTQAAVRMAIGLREDYLPFMNSLKRRIPGIDRVLFRVLPINGSQAREVMNIPDGITDTEIKLNILRQFYPKDIEPAESVPEDQLEVEPSLLNLLCYQVFEKKIKSLSIQEKDAILADFYGKELKKLPRSKELAEFIETHLLTEDGYRTPFYLEQHHKLWKVVEEAINRRILRKFYIEKREHVEIIHDVLIPVIKERRDRRLRKKQNRKIRFFASLAIVGILLAVFAFFQLFRANILYKEAKSNRLAAETFRVLPKDRLKALRIAEAGYKINASNPSPSVYQALGEAAYSTFERPFYTKNIQFEDNVTSAAFTNDGIKTLTISMDGAVKLWDSKNNMLADLKPIPRASNAFISPDGTRIITLHRDSTAKLWDLKGNLLANMDKHTGRIWSAVFSFDGSKIITISDDNTAKLWDLEGKLLADLNKHTNYISSAAFSYDGTRIVTASWDNTAKVWDLEGNVKVEYSHKDYVWSAAFSPDGRKIITTSNDKTVKVWDLKGKELNDLNRHKKIVRSVEFSPDGKTILTGTGKNLELWNLNGAVLADLHHKSEIKSAVFSSNGKSIRIISGNTIKMWEPGKLPVTSLNYTYAFDNGVISPDGSKVLIWSEDTVKLCDLNGNILAKFKHKAFISSAYFSTTGTEILTTSYNTAKRWDMEGNLLTNFNKHTANVIHAIFSPNGRKILTVSNDFKVTLWDLDGKRLDHFDTNNINVNSIVFSPDGSKILASLYDNTAKLYDLKGNLLVNFEHKDTVFSAVYSPDGSRILTASRDNTAKLFDLKGKLLIDFRGHTDAVTGAVFSHKGDRILTFSDDNTAKLWDLKGNLLADLNKHTDAVLSAAFTNEDRWIITVSNDCTVKRWYTPEAIIEWLRTAPIPPLSKEDKENLGIADFE